MTRRTAPAVVLAIVVVPIALWKLLNLRDARSIRGYENDPATL